LPGLDLCRAHRTSCAMDGISAALAMSAGSSKAARRAS
jgi:hypothetical protein